MKAHIVGKISSSVNILSNQGKAPPGKETLLFISGLNTFLEMLRGISLQSVNIIQEPLTWN